MNDKIARITTQLREHQERAKRRGVAHNIILQHGVGSGKTLTALAIAERLKRPVRFLVPASLQSNIVKEIQAHADKKGIGVPYNVMSYAKFVRSKEELPEGEVLIADEAHKLRNDTSKTQQKYLRTALKSYRNILLSGTSLYNNPVDIYTLLQSVYQGKVPVPGGRKGFERTFIKETKEQPSILHRMMGMRPGIVKELQNRDQLKQLLSGKIDYHMKKDPRYYPKSVNKVVTTEMTAEQMKMYRFLEGKLPYLTRLKIRHGLTPSKSEAKSLNSFLVGLRQIGLSTKPYVDKQTYLEAAQGSPKLVEAARIIADRLKADPKHRTIVYSNFLEAGLLPMSALLKNKEIPHSVYTGKLSKSEKDALVASYNTGKNPVMLLSSSGGEGLDLKKTRLMQILEPHFNKAKIDQVIGRGIRYKSHEGLPEKEREVEVQKFLSLIPQGTIGKLLGSKKDVGADEYLMQMSANKQKLIDSMQNVMEEASNDVF